MVRFSEWTRTIMSDAIFYWGYDAQLFMVCEEMGEVLQGISKFRRNKDTEKEIETVKHLKNEIVDLELMLDQLRLMLDFPDHEFDKLYSEKMLNLEHKLDEHQKRLLRDEDDK